MKAHLCFVLLACIPAELAAQRAAPDRMLPPDSLREVDSEVEAHISRPGGAGSVFLGAVVGGALPAAMLALNHVGSDQDSPSPGTLAAVWGSGVAVGGMLGAALTNRDIAPTWTVLATALATAPFVIFAQDSADWGGELVFAFTLPVAGAVIGNVLGQSR